MLFRFISHGQQLTEDLCIRCHTAAFQLGVHGIPHFGGGIAVGVDPLAAGHRVQLGALAGLLLLQSSSVLAGSKIGFLQRFFLRGEPCGELRQSVRRQLFGLDAGSKAAAAALRPMV